MEVIYFLLPAAILMSSVGLALFVWALRSGQYEDLEGPRWRVLYEDDSAPLAAAGSSKGGAVLPAAGRPLAEAAAALGADA